MSLWRWLTTSRHTRWLEAEVERLRADRDEARRQAWALVNSLVTTAGAPLPQEILRHAEAKADAAQDVKTAVPRGKKSWHQRAMALEIRSARELRNELHFPAPPRSEEGATADRADAGETRLKGE